MGSDVNSSSVELDDEFIKIYGCGHPEEMYTEKIYIKEIPLLEPIADIGVSALRVYLGFRTLGISELLNALFNPAEEGLNHLFVEMDFKCRKCHRITTYTADNMDRPKEPDQQFRAGYYRGGSVVGNYIKEGYWSYNYIDKNYKNPDKKEYDCICWNCQDYAKYLFNKL